MIWPRAVLGFALAALIGYLGYRRASLSGTGVVGAVVTGTLIVGFGGWAWGALLVAFFASSSALSHYKEALKESLAEKFSKGGRRDLAQVLANGGAGMLIALLSTAWPHPVWWAAFAGALATVNADTWATELGVLSRARPRLVTSGQPVEVGTSGAITLAGTLASLGGAGLIALGAGGYAFALGQGLAHSGLLLISTLVAGLGGALVDSLLGATVQSIYYCDHCGKETERHPAHHCRRPTRRVRGWRRLDNDGVNFLSSVVGSLLAAGSWLWLSR